MRFRTTTSFSLLAGLVLAAVHCGGGDDSAAPGNGSDGGGGGNDGGTGSETSIGEGGSTGNVVDGFALNGVSAYSGAPIVLLDANGTRTDVTTGNDGSFHVEGVATPYDVYLPSIDFDGGTGPSPAYYAGITRKDPVLYATDYRGTIVTTLRTGIFEYTANLNTNDKIYGSTPQGSTVDQGTGSSHLFTSLNVSWIGDATLTTDLHIYITTDDIFEGYIDKPGVTVQDGSTSNIGTLTSFNTFVGTPTAPVTQTLPAGYTASTTTINFFGLDGSRLAFRQAAAGTFSPYMIPLPNIRVQFLGAASGPNGETATTEVSYSDYSSVPISVALPIAAMPSALTPADNATGIAPATQQLGWTSGATATTFCVALSATAQPTIAIFTGGTSFDLGKLAKVGFTLAPATAYKWNVQQTYPAAIDDYVSSATHPGKVPTNVPWATGYSKQQTFTTQ